MTLARTSALVVPRDGEASSGPLTTGAIAGIACGAGALFLGAASLFIIYYRRQRRYDREDNSDSESFDDTSPRGPMAPVVTYTMDYKLDDPQHHEGEKGSSYTYSPEKASYPFSPLSASDSSSAMPTHPAYIPRALVRGSSTPSNRSIATASPPPPFPSSASHSRIQLNETMVEAYLATAQGGRGGAPIQPQQDVRSADESDTSSPGLPIQPAPPPPSLPPPTSRSVSSADEGSSSGNHQPRRNRKPRAYIPPPLNLADGTAGQNRSKGSERPLHGKEHTTISGPLAFPHFSQPPIVGDAAPPHPRREATVAIGPTTTDIWDGEGEEPWHSQMSQPSPPSDSRRTFRSRINLGGGEGSGSGSNAGGRDRAKSKKHARKRSDRNSGSGYGGNRHYTEIEIGRGSDIW
ncbi:hypothetical protein VTI28DRAFT_8258 [Corynascus sepedonium]